MLVPGSKCRARRCVNMRIISLTLLVLALSTIAGEAGADLRHHRQGHPDPATVIPTGWTREPPDPSWRGTRYFSPDGSAWFAAYVSAVEAQPIPAHMDAVASQEGEHITYSRWERDWLVVSGFKGNRIFYRKAVIACGGTMWHHIAFEYPAVRKRQMDAFVARASQSIDHAEYDSCEKTPRAQAR
jgi:hypothetical protein